MGTNTLEPTSKEAPRSGVELSGSGVQAIESYVCPLCSTSCRLHGKAGKGAGMGVCAQGDPACTSSLAVAQQR